LLNNVVKIVFLSFNEVNATEPIILLVIKLGKLKVMLNAEDT